MSNENLLETFMLSADAWVCDKYALDIRYVGYGNRSSVAIWDAYIGLSPLPLPDGTSFNLDFDNFIVGQALRPQMSKTALMRFLSRASMGEITTGDRTLKLQAAQPIDYYSEMAHRDSWFSQLHLQLTGDQRPHPTNMELATIDSALRTATPPFDGLTDLGAWLGLSVPGTSSNRTAINIRVGPPVDLIVPQGTLSKDFLTLTVHAHPKFDVNRVSLAVRAVPGVALGGRQQIADKIKWGRVRNGRRVGIAKVKLEAADNALAMLLIEGYTVRRQWFIDPDKARNNRLLAVQHFDKDLRMTKQAVLESMDSGKFEHGVATLLFLLGFTPSVQLETDAPDLIVTTPGGKLAIVECTMRIADFSAKVGKLVDRRGALSKHLSASKHPAEITAVLVCRLPRDQIAAQAADLRTHEILLVTHEDLLSGFDRVRISNDSDEMIDTALTQLRRGPTPSFK